MRIISLDVGSKRIGIAISDEGQQIATAISTVNRSSDNNDINSIKQIIEHYEANKIVIGLPYNTDGSIGKSAKAIQKFSKTLQKLVSVPIVYIDETNTTYNAQNILLEADLSRKKRKKLIDKVSAVLILQEYLENREDYQ